MLGRYAMISRIRVPARRRPARTCPHRPEAQDVALSRPKHGFESRWGRHPPSTRNSREESAERQSRLPLVPRLAAVITRQRECDFADQELGLITAELLLKCSVHLPAPRV